MGQLVVEPILGLMGPKLFPEPLSQPSAFRPASICARRRQRAWCAGYRRRRWNVAAAVACGREYGLLIFGDTRQIYSLLRNGPRLVGYCVRHGPRSGPGAA